MYQCLSACLDAGVRCAHCTRLSETWLVLHVDLDTIDARMKLSKSLQPFLRQSKRVTVGVAEDDSIRSTFRRDGVVVSRSR